MVIGGASVTSVGGRVSIVGGTSTANGGAVFVRGGAGATGSTGGNVTIVAGAAASGTGGAVQIAGSNSVSQVTVDDNGPKLLSTNGTQYLIVGTLGVTLSNLPSTSAGLGSGGIYKDGSNFLKIV